VIKGRKSGIIGTTWGTLPCLKSPPSGYTMTKKEQAVRAVTPPLEG